MTIELTGVKKDLLQLLKWGKELAERDDFGTFWEDRADEFIFQLTPPRTEEQEVVQYPLVSVSFFDHSKQEWVNKVGHIEHSGHFVYLEEVIHPNGGEGLKMYSVSPDNYHQMSSSEGQVG